MNYSKRRNVTYKKQSRKNGKYLKLKLKKNKKHANSLRRNKNNNIRKTSIRYRRRRQRGGEDGEDGEGGEGEGGESKVEGEGENENFQHIINNIIKALQAQCKENCNENDGLIKNLHQLVAHVDKTMTNNTKTNESLKLIKTSIKQLDELLTAYKPKHADIIDILISSRSTNDEKVLLLSALLNIDDFKNTCISFLESLKGDGDGGDEKVCGDSEKDEDIDKNINYKIKKIEEMNKIEANDSTNNESKHLTSIICVHSSNDEKDSETKKETNKELDEFYKRLIINKFIKSNKSILNSFSSGEVTFEDGNDMITKLLETIDDNMQVHIKDIHDYLKKNKEDENTEEEGKDENKEKVVVEPNDKIHYDKIIGSIKKFKHCKGKITVDGDFQFRDENPSTKSKYSVANELRQAYGRMTNNSVDRAKNDVKALNKTGNDRINTQHNKLTETKVNTNIKNAEASLENAETELNNARNQGGGGKQSYTKLQEVITRMRNDLNVHINHNK